MSASALIVISRGAGRERPLLFERVMGTPLLTWLCCGLFRRGFRRFAFVSPERWAQSALSCVPEGCEVCACPERLREFLFLSQGRLLVITGPCVIVPGMGSGDAPVCRIPAMELSAAMDDHPFCLSRLIREKGETLSPEEDFYPVSGPSAIPEAAQLLRQARLRELRAQGVEIWDDRNCYIGPGVTIGAGTSVLPGANLRGRTSVGRDCVLGPGVWLENTVLGSGCRLDGCRLYDCTAGSECAVGPGSDLRGVSLGSRVRVGASCELHAASLGDGTRLDAMCVLRDVRAGRNCRIGPGCLLAASEPPGTVTLGDDVLLGAGSVLAAPISVGRSAASAAGAILTEPVPPQALAFPRSKPALRKDWALHG